jgi:hypothetical protein
MEETAPATCAVVVAQPVMTPPPQAGMTIPNTRAIVPMGVSTQGGVASSGASATLLQIKWVDPYSPGPLSLSLMMFREGGVVPLRSEDGEHGAYHELRVNHPAKHPRAFLGMT